MANVISKIKASNGLEYDINVRTMTGASASEDGEAGAVPAPSTGDQNKYLRGDGTWANIGGAGHTIVDANGNEMAARGKLQFTNATVTDNAENDTTVVTTQGGGSVIKLADVSGASATSDRGTKTVVLKWTDPEDVEISGVKFATWAGTRVVRKVDSAPSNASDGTVVVNSTTRDQYSSNGFSDTGLTYGVTYYYRFFPYSAEGAETQGTSLNVVPQRLQVEVPTAGTQLVYNGDEQTQGFNGYDSTKMTVSGNTGTDAGDYTATFTPSDDYEWSDASRGGKDVAWSIEKANGSATISASSVTLDADHLAATVTVSNTTGDIGTPTTSDSSVATVSISGSTVTISSVNETTGAATITIPILESDNYKAVNKTVSVTASFTQIYGVEWEGTSATSMSRTDAAASFTDPKPYYSGMGGTPSSPFDSISPWKDLKRVTNATAGEVVSIPKYYYKWTKNGVKMKLQISSSEFDGSYVSPAHADRGDGKGERDIVYVGRYHCASSTYKSTTGVTPQVNVTRANFRTSIHNLGSTIWQYDYAMFWTIAMLYLVEYADWNSQDKLGGGCSATTSSSSAVYNMGSTDSMPYHSGTASNSIGRTVYGANQYRYIENLWGNCYDWCDGIYFSGADVYCIKNPANFSDTANGTKVGTRPTSSNYISAWSVPTISGYEYALYPSAIAGGEASYIGDYCNYSASGVVLHVGGCYNQSQVFGLIFLGGGAASGKGANIGSRLQILP